MGRLAADVIARTPGSEPGGTRRSRSRQAPHVPLDCSHGGLACQELRLRWRYVLWRLAFDPWFKPVWRSGVAPDQPHIRSSRCGRLHLDSAFGGAGSGGGTILRFGFLDAKQSIGRRPGSAEADQSSADERRSELWLVAGQAEDVMAAPSITTPALVNFHSATNSFRASATISRLRAALPTMPGSRA